MEPTVHVFEIDDSWLRIIICGLDAFAGFTIVYLMQALTAHACFTGGRQAQWAMVRRVILLIAAMSLFTKGAWRIEQPAPVSFVEFWTQLGIITSLVVFPILRWLDVITQDEMQDSLHKR